MAKKIKKVTTTVTEEIIEINNEKTQIICILDRSGSMEENGIIHEAIGGFNGFIEEQKKLKDTATMTVALFDDRYELVYDDVDIKSVEKMTYAIWTPRGMTALYDAIGKTINTVRANHNKLGVEKPAKVLVCIVTDGKENASHEYNREGIKKLIKDCEADNWNFIYLAANQNAFEVGTSFGVAAGNTFTYTASSRGVADMSNVMNMATTSYRSVNTSDAQFSVKSKSLIDIKDLDKDNVNLTGDLSNYTLSGGTFMNTTGTYTTNLKQ